MTNVEDRLSHALRSTADSAVYDATPLSAITGQADRIRRQRRRRAVLATAAAVGVIAIPSAVFLRPDAAPTPGPPTAPEITSPSVVPTPPPPSTTPPRPSFDVEDMPLGSPPRLGYVVNGEYVAPDGTRQPEPPDGGALGQFAQVGDEFLYTETAYGMSNEGEPIAVATYRRTPDGEDQSLGCSDGLHSGSDGEVAYLTAPCPGSGDGSAPALYVVDPTSGTATRRVPETSGYPELILMRGDEVIVRDSATRQLWVVPPTGEPQQLAALTEWKLKDSEIVSFSPDGRHVLLQGNSWPGNTIADAATGEVLGAVPLTMFSGVRGLYGLTWEDNDHLLGLYEGALLRVDLTGGLEVAAKNLPQAVRLENDKSF